MVDWHTTEALVLSKKPLSDSRLILEVLSHSFGKLSIVHRQPSNLKKQALRCDLFDHIFFQFRFKPQTELINPTRFELQRRFRLSGIALYAGFYANELILKLCPFSDPCYDIFKHYTHLIHHLSGLLKSKQLNTESLWCIRLFEFCLLSRLGFSPFDEKKIMANDTYDINFLKLGQLSVCHSKEGIAGQLLLALTNFNHQPSKLILEDVNQLRMLQKLQAHWLNSLLDYRPLKTRSLLEAYIQI